MRAAAIDRFGGAERIALQTLPVPKAGPDEIVIRVETAGVAVWDTFEREGGFAEMFGLKPVFPYVLGTDGAGTVATRGGTGDPFPRRRPRLRRSAGKPERRLLRRVCGSEQR